MAYYYKKKMIDCYFMMCYTIIQGFPLLTECDLTQ